MSRALHMLATSDPTGTILATWGAPGALVVVLGLFAWAAYKRERDRADRLEAELREQNGKITDRLAEVLSQSRDALKDVNDYLRDLTHRRR
jgi:hypothetical protein